MGILRALVYSFKRLECIEVRSHQVRICRMRKKHGRSDYTEGYIGWVRTLSGDLQLLMTAGNLQLRLLV